MTDEQRRVMSFLSGYRFKRQEVEQLRILVDECEAELDGLRAQALTGMPAGSATGSMIEAAVMRLDGRRGRYVQAKAEAEAVLERIETVIAAVDDDRARLLLQFRYVMCLPWCEVAMRMAYSEESVYRIHREALKNICL